MKISCDCRFRECCIYRNRNSCIRENGLNASRCVHLSHDHSHNPELKELTTKTQLTDNETFVGVSSFSQWVSPGHWRTSEKHRRCVASRINEYLDDSFRYIPQITRIRISKFHSDLFHSARHKHSLFFFITTQTCQNPYFEIHFPPLPLSETDRYQWYPNSFQVARNFYQMIEPDPKSVLTRPAFYITLSALSRASLNSFVESSSFHLRQSGLHVKPNNSVCLRNVPSTIAQQRRDELLINLV